MVGSSFGGTIAESLSGLSCTCILDDFMVSDYFLGQFEIVESCCYTPLAKGARLQAAVSDLAPSVNFWGVHTLSNVDMWVKRLEGIDF